MRPRLHGLGIPVFLLAATAQLPAADLASLLDRLAKHQEAIRPVYDGGFTMTSRVEQLDKTGRPETTLETVEKVTRKDGNQQNELVRAVRDGKDITEQERRRRAERGEAAKKEGSGSRRQSVSALNPFGRDEQAKYRFTLAGPDPSAPGRVLIRFEPKGAPSERTNTGEAVVDEAAAVPIRVRYRPSAYPKHVKKMDAELEYGVPTSAGPVLSAFSIDAEGGLLFIKKRIRTKTTFSDYAAH